MADETLKLKLEVDGKNSIKTLDGLEGKLQDLKTRIKDVEIGSTEFKKMSAEIKKTESQVKNLNKSLEGLDTDQLTGEFGRLTGGITAAFTGIISLSGEANESMENMVKTVAKGMAIAQGFRGAAEAVTAATRVWTVAQRVLNAVMKANPIGAVITAITLLIAAATSLFFWLKNTKKETNKNAEANKGWKKRLDDTTLSIREQKKALEELRDELALQRGEITEGEKDKNDIVRKYNKLITVENKKYFDEKKKLEDEFNKWVEETGDLGSRERIIKENELSEKIIELVTVRNNKIITLQQLMNQELKKVDIDVSNKIDDNTDATKAWREEIERLGKSLLIIDQVDLPELESPELENEKVKTNEDYKLELYRQTYEGKQQLLLEQLQNGEIAEMEYNDKMLQLEQEKANDEARIAEDLKNKKIQYAQAAFSVMSNLLNALSNLYETQKQNELKLAGDNEEEKIKIEKEYAKKKKRMAIIQANIQIAQSILQAFATMGPPLSYIFAAITAAMGAVQLATIQKQQFAKGGILSGPSHAQGGILTPYGELEGDEIVLNKGVTYNPSLRNVASSLNTSTGGNSFATGDGSIKLSEESLDVLASKINNKKVYVTETDITEKQNKVAVIEREAVL